MQTIEQILLAIGAILCVILLIQDLRGRWIHVYPVIALFLLGLVFRWIQSGPDMWMEVLATAIFISLILGLTWAVMKLRGKAGRFLDEKLGLGDVIMFYAVAGWFDPFGYALFFVSGILLVLIFIIALMITKRIQKDYPIPLAGLLAGYLLIFFPAYQALQGIIFQLYLGV